VEREPSFLRDLMLDALRSDGGAAEVLLELLTRHPEAKLKLAQAVAGSIAVPLNVATKDDIKAAVEELKKWAEEEFVTKEDLKQYATKQDLETAVEQLKKWAEEKLATKEDLKQFATKEDLRQLATKEDLKQFATKEDIKRIEDKMATKEQFEAITVSVEDSGRDMVQYLLEQRGYKCVAERLRLDADYELDIYCNAGVLTAVGEAKVRTGGRDVEKALQRAQELLRRQPDKISGKLVPVFYTLVAEPSAIQKAKELKIWLIESRREVVTLEEVLGRI